MDSLPSINQNFPIPSNMCSFKNTADLIWNNKFPKLADSDLHLIIGIHEAELINFEKIRKPCVTLMNLLSDYASWAGPLWTRPIFKE